ncbi:MAG: hypothetical protein IPP80_14500 [Ignavibacteria bacterium]|nr:hypothetical protein [Ignavibacteria bacterium]
MPRSPGDWVHRVGEERSHDGGDTCYHFGRGRDYTDIAAYHFESLAN